MIRGSRTGEERPLPESRVSPSNTLIDAIQATDASERYAEYEEQEQPKEEALSSSLHTVHPVNEEIVITRCYLATEVAIGLRRLPAGFYAIVHHSGLEWRTKNNALTATDDVYWDGPILIPSDPSATVRLEVYASFEFEPALGVGEQLRNFTTTVEEILDRSAKNISFTFFPKDGDVVSPCTSISVTVERWRSESGDLLTSTLLGPHHSGVKSKCGLEDATNQGHGALSRYRKLGMKQDLERSIEDFGRALGTCPPDHPGRAVVQSNLAMAKFIHYQAEDTDISSLDAPLSLYHDALVARPVGHPDRPITLIQLAAIHIVRFKRQRNEADVTQAQELLQEVIKLDLTESHEKRAATFMLQIRDGHVADLVPAGGQSSVVRSSASQLDSIDLANASVQLLRNYELVGDVADLQQAIAVLQGLVGSTSILDDQDNSELMNLGSALLYRFRRFGDPRDLDEAISWHRKAADLTPYGHPYKSSYFNDLGNSFLTRFKRLKSPADLHDAISAYEKSIDLTHRGDPDIPARLSNLGLSLKSRFENLGELADLDRAILTLKDAVNLIPHGHPDKPEHLISLAISFGARFRQLEELNDLDEQISAFSDAIDLGPHEHSNKAGWLNNLGASFLVRFERMGELRDLEQAISRLQEANDLVPHAHPDKPVCLSGLGTGFHTRFDRLGELNDLEDAISMHKEAVRLTPLAHPNKPSQFNCLGTSLFARFERLGELHDIEDAISLHKEAVDLTPPTDPDKPWRLNSLGVSFLTRFERLGELCDIEDAILLHRESIDLIPLDHPDKPGCLNNLGSCFRRRFDRLGELRDLEEAILLQRDSVNLTTGDHPSKAAYLNNLAASLVARFDRLGQLSDIEDATSMQREAVDLIPDGHPHKPHRLANLANSFFFRFLCLGESSDLENAIHALGDAAGLIPRGHRDKPAILNNLGASLKTRFDRFGELSDIQHAILILKDAVEPIPLGGLPNREHLNNLGNAFVARFDRLGELSDLEQAISVLKDAVDLTPHDHPDKSTLLDSLGLSILSRFERLGQLSDLEDAILRHKEAVYLTPHGNPHKPNRLNNLANSFVTRFERLGELRDLEQAVSLYTHAASSPIGSVVFRFRASRRWISCARLIGHHSLLHAYSVAVSLLPQLAWIGLSLPHRYSELTRGADVVREAVAAALDAGLPEIAVEWLEQGRSIVWDELTQLRSPYEELSSAHPDHARRLQELSAALEHASVTREKSLSALSEQNQNVRRHGTTSLDQQADRHRTLALKRDELLQEIRSFPGFRQFLLRKEFSHLRASVRTGPVVILNAAETRCDALVVVPNVPHAIHVPLASFTLKRSADLQNILNVFLRAHTVRSDEREGRSAPWETVSWDTFLSILWRTTVRPVLDALAFSILTRDPSRIFWCPTGPFVFFPIHAAGLYDAKYSHPGHKVYDFVISSYVPTLAVLAQSRYPATEPDGDLCLLTVRQPPTDGQPHLPGVATELEYIEKAISNSTCTTLLESSDGSVEEVLSLMKEADWVHFACHGTQDALNSGLCLADGRRLKLRDIIALSRPHGGLAFLSACQTVMGYERLADEAIHIAAGMLFAGYGGVVGTMWSISDRIAPEVARDVYEQLFESGKRPDYRQAARALHEAIGRLRESGASFNEWLPFIHVGL